MCDWSSSTPARRTTSRSGGRWPTTRSADELLRLACLTNGDDDPGRPRQAAALLTAHPQLAWASIYTAAATDEC